MRDDRPPFLDSLFDELKTHGPYVSMAHAQRAADRLTRAYNDRPQADLGGLSPNQMRELLDADWSAPNSALMLDDTLSVDDVAQAPMVTDARFILDYVAGHGPLKETAAHNLTRADVAALSPHLELVRQRLGDVDGVMPAPTFVNEGDVYWLLLLRHLLVFAGLLLRRKGFRILLVAFGLCEERLLPAVGVLRPTEYRITPLYRRFVRFRFGPNAAPGPVLVR